MHEPFSRRLSWGLIAALWLTSLLLALADVHRQGGMAALFSDHNLDPAAIILHSMWLPRQGMAMVGGATLGLCGWLMQRALRNPLAEPMTLGMTAGATLAMGLASLWMPSLLVGARTGVVIAGELAALACVLALSWRQRLSPLVMVQAGIMINLWCGALTLLIAIINDRFLLQVLMWGGGSLAVEDGQTLLRMLPWLALCFVGLLFLLRPLELLQLPETVVSSLGASPLRIRGAAVLLALSMSAVIINAVGVIGFLGLAAPHLARFGGARTSRQMVLHTALIGAGLLWLTDLCVSRVSLENGQLLPVGMLTALTGGPLLMLLARAARQPVIDLAPLLPVSSTPQQRRFIWLSAGILSAGIVVSLCFGHGLQHWHWAGKEELANLLPLRLPRLLAAVSAGALLAGAGVLMQRVSGNPLASPEVLGIGGGAAMGVTAFVFLFPSGGGGGLLASSLCGALISLLLTLWNSRRSAFNPQRVLLNGLALNALCQAAVSIVMINNLTASAVLLPLMTGSTYYIGASLAQGVFFVTLVILALVPLFRRWLVLLPMGNVAGSLGVALPRARFSVLGMAAVMTGLATLLVGPVSFIGLLGPHLARKIGAKGPLAQLYTAALLSAAIMTVADWLGRNALYPRQLPVGLVASLIGVPLLIGPLIRHRAPRSKS
ncbi:Ferric hydroxamate ABC transporter [Klebsiella oxytoca]|uniref:Fe(3+)-hydroxamate ABC transporter permease FhuB n=1 Tax=Serratia TaxID=613 RepID=UPI0007CBD24F|nr:Fe(3+)-hydroxamate ABC transporter permease FhuB [Serratia marcescens]AWQ48668.1 Fe3+-hydroxamate ABC transporter permease FhuB [Serratia marcescens]SAP49384.1 Ferric hydroxamate ABC transporter [Klebsiella oxytoca]HEO8932230.1 Fe(3+)-hydroxamate ABC transporter permease FhuB [Serratia marcescens]HEP0988436.1 Fe(3+)-hydroxamate ABC transporter permease FhuB [Serratia marcescens]